MIKFKKVLLTVISVMAVLVMASCTKQQQPKVEFLSYQINIMLGEERTLDDASLLKIENAKINDVHFVSEDQNVVFISPENVIMTVGRGTTKIHASIKGSQASIFVNVTAQNKPFVKVSEIVYNPLTAEVSWNPPFALVDGKQVVATAFDVKITRNNLSYSNYEKISDTKYRFLQGGNYTVFVRAIAPGFAYSEEVFTTFTVLNAPTGLEFTKGSINTHTVRWDRVENAVLYELAVNDEVYVVSSNSYTLNLEDAKTYNIKVKAIKSENEHSVYTDALQVTKLSKPTLKLENGVLKVVLSKQEEIKHFALTVKAYQNEEDIYNFTSTTGEFDLSSLPAGNYLSYVVSVAKDNKYIISSEVSQTFDFEKLSAPSITFDTLTNQIVVTGIEQDVKLYIEDILNQTVEQFEFVDGKYTLIKPYGEFKFWAQNLANVENTINSTVSNMLTVKVLGITKDVDHTEIFEDNTEKSVLSFQKVVGATDYQIKVNNVVYDAQPYQEIENRISYVLELPSNQVFSLAQEYEIEIVALDLSYSNILVYGQSPNNNKTYVTRLDATEEVNIITPIISEPITWQVPVGATGFAYNLYRYGLLIDEGSLAVPSFEVENLIFGDYNLNIYTIGNQKEFLSSINYASVNFSKQEELSGPILSFNRENNTLVIEEVENASAYRVFYEDELIETLTDNLSFDISSYLIEKGNHNFYVVAVNLEDNSEGDGNLVPSEPSDLSIIKLESVKKVIYENEEVFKYDDDLLLSEQNSQEFDLQVKIDDNVVDLNQIDLSLKESFVLTVTKIANINLTSPYYISSESFVLNYQRLPEPQNLNFVNWVIGWDTVEDADGYEVVISKDDFSQTLLLNENQIDLTLQDFYTSLESGFDFTVKAFASQSYFESEQTQKISSFVSNKMEVGVLDTPEIISVENISENEYKVVWTLIAGAEYLIDFENLTQEINQNEIVLTLDANKAIHTLKLKAVSPNHISSYENVFVFEKFEKVESINVFADSTFEIDYNLILQAKLLVNQTQVLPNTKIDILSVEPNATVYEFAVKIEADFIDENTYYISSDNSEFGFVKFEGVNNLRVEDGYIKWQENPNASNYELVFENDANQTLSIILPARDNEENYINKISLTDERIEEFITDNSLNYTVKIKVKIEDYQLESNATGKIDSNLSQSVEILKLSQVKNVKVNVFDNSDKQQQVLTISWDATAGASYYNVFVNNQLLLENQTLTSIETDTFTFENSIMENGVLTGRFEVVVLAYANNKVVSEPSDVLVFNRLGKVKGFKTTDNTGGLQWNANDFSDSFVFYMQNQTNQSSDLIEIENVVSYNFSSLLEDEKFKEGKFELNLLVFGNGETTFSSAYEKLEVIRLEAPIFEILGDKIVTEESLIFEDASFELTVYFKEDGQESLVKIQKINLLKGQFLLPTEWKYQDGSAIVNNGEFVFEMVAVHTNYITSLKSSIEKVKLNAAVIDGFRRVEDTQLSGETSFEFLIDVGNVSQTPEGENPDIEVVFTVKNNLDNLTFTYIDNTAKNRQGQIVYDMPELFLAMKGNFVVEIKLSAVGYIDSKIIKINGSRIEQNTSLQSRNGLLTWTRSLATSANGYMLKVNHTKVEQEGILIKHIDNLSVVSDTLEGISGLITTNVKILSNMPINTVVKTNVVLDSFYMGQVEVLEDDSLLFEEIPYIATKLPALENVTINQGMFYFEKETDIQAEYVLIALDGNFEGVEYSLKVEYEDDNSVYALSQMFYQGAYKLLPENIYTFSIKAIAVAANGLNSDAGQALRVKTLDSVTNINVSWKEYETGETNRFDSVVISWSPSLTLPNARYIYSIDGVSVNEDVFNITESNEYIITSNNALKAKNHNFSVRVMGTSSENSEGFYYLTSASSSSIVLRGLATPVVEIKDGVFTWQQVPFAEGYYIYYMKKTTNENIVTNSFSQNKTWFSEFITTTSWKMPESFSDSNILNAYYIAVVAINREISMRYLPSAYGTLYNLVEEAGEEEPVEIFKYFVVAKAPDIFQNNDGVMMWYGLDYEYDINIFTQEFQLLEGINPFVYGLRLDMLLETLITIRITDSTGRVIEKNINAVDLFEADLFKSPLFEIFAPTLEFEFPNYYGVGHIDKFINESFPSIKAGSNFVSAMQIGNNGNLLNSKYNDGREFYVPQQVNTRISSSVLAWNKIELPTNKPYLKGDVEYIVISEDDEGERIIVTRTTDLSINLIDFVNDDTLKAGNHKLYVIVAGDGGYYLNGIAGPSISTFVLPSVSASLDKGVLYWNSMQNTSEYLVKALSGGEEDNFIQTMNTNIWDFGTLRATDGAGNNIEYSLTLQAVGNGVTIISGKETNFGKIIRLETPQVSIVKGIFEWADIENNLGYMIDVSGDDNHTFTIGTSINQYESIYSGFNTYNFRAVGSTTSNIGENTLNYGISSYMNQSINAVMLPSVKGTRTYNGQIAWQAMTDFAGISINEFKLTFDQSNFKPAVFLTSNDYSSEVMGGFTNLLYQLSEDYGPGLYKIYLQAHSTRTLVIGDTSYLYLLGKIEEDSSSTEFEKLRAVENIRVDNGSIYWDDPNSYDSNYKITFVQGAQSFEFITNQKHFNPTTLTEEELELYDQISALSPVDVKVQVLGNTTDLINSDEVRVNNFTKLRTIIEFDYVSDQNEETGFIIRWYLQNTEVGVSRYEYVISYIDNPETGEVKTISSIESDLIVTKYDYERQLYYAEIDAAYLLNQGSSTLIYKVAAVPVTNSNIISSSYSEPRSVSPPESLSGSFNFDALAQKISWEYEREGSDVIFRIVDELVHLTEDNQVIVLKTNVYMSQEKQFFPTEIGLHRIKIAVVLGTGKVSSGYVYFNHLEATGLINNSEFIVTSPFDSQQFTLLDFNLFESGEGSSTNPYIISNAAHFANINYRPNKPTYLQGESKFTFIQSDNIVANNLTRGIANFAGNYDGQGNTLTYTLTSSQQTVSQEVSLFINIESTGIVKNLAVNSKLILNNSALVQNVRISAFSIINDGLIENLLIKQFNLVSNITNNQVVYTYAAVAVQNNGTIYKTISLAHINFIGGPTGQSMLNADITVGGLVENNAGQIVNSGSSANINVVARRVTVAGVAVISQVNASISGSFNKGSITVAITATNSIASYIGGIVGQNRGLISSSYSSASSIDVDLANTSNTVYIGGIAGMNAGQNGFLINNSFTLTTNINLDNFASSTTEVGLIIGQANAQGHQNQVKSYYRDNSSLNVINGNQTFVSEAISTMQDLLTKLNGYEPNVFALVADQIYHLWQDDFVLV